MDRQLAEHWKVVAAPTALHATMALPPDFHICRVGGDQRWTRASWKYRPNWCVYRCKKIASWRIRLRPSIRQLRLFSLSAFAARSRNNNELEMFNERWSCYFQLLTTVMIVKACCTQSQINHALFASTQSRGKNVITVPTPASDSKTAEAQLIAEWCRVEVIVVPVR